MKINSNIVSLGAGQWPDAELYPALQKARTKKTARSAHKQCEMLSNFQRNTNTNSFMDVSLTTVKHVLSAVNRN